MELEDIADELYALLPEEFTAARDWRAAQLRRAGDRELSTSVKALRRPAVAAWLVNSLVRQHTGEVDQLLELGDALRSAQGALDADQLRELGRRRQEVLAALARQARALASGLGRPVSPAAADDVEETLRAALADPAAADAVRTGRLTTALSYAGFGEVDLTDAVAGRLRPRLVPRPATPQPSESEPSASSPVVEPAAPDRQAEQERAWAALRVAEETWHRAELARRRAEQHRDTVLRREGSAKERVDAAQARVAELEAVLAGARQNATAAVTAWQPLRAEADAAVQAADAARAASDRARLAVDAARTGVDGAAG